MTIHIEDLKFQCVIGILDFEREKPQDIIINISIKYNSKNDFLNYADIVDFVKKKMIYGKFLLLEDAIRSISISLKQDFDIIETIDIKLTKPSILRDCNVSVSNHYNFKS